MGEFALLTHKCIKTDGGMVGSTDVCKGDVTKMRNGTINRTIHGMNCKPNIGPFLAYGYVIMVN